MMDVIAVVVFVACTFLACSVYEGLTSPPARDANLAPARGCAVALLLGIVFWGVVVWIVLP